MWDATVNKIYALQGVMAGLRLPLAVRSSLPSIQRVPLSQQSGPIFPQAGGSCQLCWIDSQS